MSTASTSPAITQTTSHGGSCSSSSSSSSDSPRSLPCSTRETRLRFRTTRVYLESRDHTLDPSPRFPCGADARPSSALHIAEPSRPLFGTGMWRMRGRPQGVPAANGEQVFHDCSALLLALMGLFEGVRSSGLIAVNQGQQCKRPLCEDVFEGW